MEDFELQKKSFAADTAEDQNVRHVRYFRDTILNPNNFSYWFRKIRGLREKSIVVPLSFVIFVPDNVQISFFGEREGDMQRITDWFHECVEPVIKDNFAGKHIFMKNGCFSNKFEFDKSCHIFPNDDAVDIIRKMNNIMYTSLCYDTDGCGELVLRDWVNPSEDAKSIYQGMPFRPEMRVFYDFDKKKILYTVNYWDWDYCHDHICECCGERTPDADVYEGEYAKEQRMVEVWGEQHLPLIEEALATVDMKGCWSVDFILDKDRVILIDMALARQSAYWDEKKVKA